MAGGATPARPQALGAVGRVLGDRYRLRAFLGAGASAAVYEAEDVVLRRGVAIKVLHPGLAADPAFLRRFQVEAQVAAGLRHANVLAVHDWGDDPAEPSAWLVMEHLEGGSLRDLLDGGHRASPAQALVIGVQAAKGLDHAHRRGLVHRDIKPANLLFDADGRVCVADFGLARAIAEAAVTEPLGAVLGTARYASPEQVLGRPLDGRSDVWSLALCLVEAVTGAVPFAADSVAATLQARVGHDLIPPPALGPLAAAVAAAGRADPADRPEAAAFVRLLQAAAPALERPAPLPIARSEHRRLLVAHDDDLTVVQTAEPAPSRGDDGPPGSPEGVAPPPRRRRRRSWVVAIVLLAGLAVGAVAAVERPWRPTVAVPVLVGVSEVQARATLGGLHVGATVVARRASEAVPSGDVLSASPRTVRRGDAVHLVVSTGPEARAVPAVVGLDQAAASSMLTALGLLVQAAPRTDEVAPAGVVLAVAPGVGARIDRGAVVVLSVSAGAAPRTLPTDVKGAGVDAVTAQLVAAGFTVTRVDAFDDEVAAGRVVGLAPVAGSSAPKGSAVTVTVSKGPDLVVVPQVAGSSPTAAQAALGKVGLTVRATYGPPGGRVLLTKPGAGSKIKRGSPVDLYTG